MTLSEKKIMIGEISRSFDKQCSFILHLSESLLPVYPAREQNTLLNC